MSSLLTTASNVVGLPTQQGAVTPVFLAISEEAGRAENRGEYWTRCHRQWVHGWMADTTLRKALWQKWAEDSGLENVVF